MSVCFLGFLVVLWWSSLVGGLENGVARTPPMGWMSWERYRCITDCTLYPNECISESLFRRAANLIASQGYKEAGYEYVIVDDCWMTRDRDENGRLQADPARFPQGMRSLSDHVHSKGLKFGIYEDYGTHTCQKYPGIKGHLKDDAETFIDWEVDYVKIDGCYAQKEEYAQGYTEFGQYLNKSERPIVYSCSWPAYIEPDNITADYDYLSKICNLWRNWDDIEDSYTSLKSIIEWFAQNQDRIQPYAGPGHWNDPDMLIIGNFGLSYEQAKSQMAIWAVLAAPLIMSVDLDSIRPEFKDILLNKDLIAINQDKLGIQGRMVETISKISVWTRPVEPVVSGRHSYAVVFHSLREDGYPFAINCTLARFGLNNTLGYYVINLFDSYETTTDLILRPEDRFLVKVKPSGVVVLKAVPVDVPIAILS